MSQNFFDISHCAHVRLVLGPSSSAAHLYKTREG